MSDFVCFFRFCCYSFICFSFSFLSSLWRNSFSFLSFHSLPSLTSLPILHSFPSFLPSVFFLFPGFYLSLSPPSFSLLCYLFLFPSFTPSLTSSFVCFLFSLSDLAFISPLFFLPQLSSFLFPSFLPFPSACSLNPFLFPSSFSTSCCFFFSFPPSLPASLSLTIIIFFLYSFPSSCVIILCSPVIYPPS